MNKSSAFFLIFLLTICSCNTAEKKVTGLKEKRIRKKAITISEEYVAKQLRDERTRDEKDGVIVIGDDQKKYVIDPGRIYIGLINEDEKPDVIVSIDRYTGQYQTVSEHLFIFKTKDKYELITSIESDMRILGLENKIITAEVPTHTRNSPLFHCPSCREVKKFRFSKGELVPAE